MEINSFISINAVLAFLSAFFFVSFFIQRSKRIHAESDMEQQRKRIIRMEDEIKKYRTELTEQLHSSERTIAQLEDELSKHKTNLESLLNSNLSSMPWLAGMMADFITYDLEVEAKKLDWGHNVQRQKKVASIRDIRASAAERVAEAKEAIYQLDYLLALFPGLQDVLATDYKELSFSETIPDHDPSMDYLTREEWISLSEIERDQLALDRYVQSRKKSNWQIGRDYELAVAYEYQKKGYEVETFGSYMQLEDLGRDLIAKKGSDVLIIQCKYWAKNKTIHEKHIFQLYGTQVSYCIETGIDLTCVHGIFVTNTVLSEMAKKVASQLGIYVVENHAMVEFPRIKCNIGKGEFGETTRIYHLPMDAMYDKTKITKKGEFFAKTVYEATAAGFRRAYKWHGTL